MDSEPHSSSDGTPRGLNAATHWPALGIGPRLPAASLALAYAFACERLAGVRLSFPGYRLFWTHDGELGFMDLPSGGAFAVLGRHTACDAVLRADAEISLRHLLATTVELADGFALRIIDLQTNLPFYLSDELPRRSIVACGPVALRLGRYVLGAIPLDPGTPDRPALPGPSELPPAIVSEAVSVPMSTGAVRAEIGGLGDVSWLPEDIERHAPISRITIMPPSAPLTDLAERRSAPGALRVGSPSSVESAHIVVRRDQKEAKVELTLPELEAGVLIGRSPRCRDGGVHAVLDTNISRGHLLLLHHHQVFEAFDLCSTQGTFEGRRAVRRVLLHDEGTTLQLAVKNPVTIAWRRF